MSGAQLAEFLIDRIQRGLPVLGTQYVTVTTTLITTQPATAGNYGNFFTVPFKKGELVALSVSHQGEGGAGANVKVIKQGTPDVDVTSTVDLSNAANNDKGISAAVLPNSLVRNDVLTLVSGGTPTGMDFLVVTALIRIDEP